MRPLSLLIAFMLFNTSIASAALVYDPVSNTYIDDSPAETTTSEESTEAADTTTTDDTTTDTNEEEDTAEADTTSVSSVSTSSNTYDGILASLHQLLDQYADQLDDAIWDSYISLQEALATSDDTVALQLRLDVLQCVGVLDDEFDIIETIKDTQKDLRTRILLAVADTHSEIEALESKIDQNLLDDFEENLEMSVIQNKVESILNEYINVIDMYFDLSQERIIELEVEIESNNETYQQILRNYDKRVQLLEDLESSYDDFTKKSSFIWVVVGPSINEVLDAIDEIKRYYRIQFMADWSDSIGAYLTDSGDYQADARVRFNREFTSYLDTLLNDLYPLEDLEHINQSILTLRAAYTHGDGVLDCRAAATNPTIDQRALTLQDEMASLISDLNASANKVTDDDGDLPTTPKALQKQLLEYAKSFQTQEQDSLLRDEKFRVQTAVWTARLPTKSLSKARTWEKAVRVFLLAQYNTAIERDTIDSFETKLRNALTKIEVALPKASGKAEDMLEVIQAVIKEFV